VTTILLARHGETDWNRDNRFQGQADPPLNAAGREQARALADALSGEPLAAVYTSPLRRAAETAEIVAAPQGLRVEPVDGLREVDVGSWEGRTRTDLEERQPEQFRRWLVEHEQGWDDGETYEEMGRRVVPALLAVAERHRGERILAVTHGGPIRAAMAASEGITHAEARRLGPVIGNGFVAGFAAEDGVLRRLD
jgi:2,3-bisphosphoglycerate-dependent phosphoglycerate mutase